ncbi:hypothetical protein CW748_09980 [Alteromonadales bacterium alter-6D02]|nr:hypothetical protein CW748_09980 [Alteromonadales bacterium alter-6D02]
MKRVVLFFAAPITAFYSPVSFAESKLVKSQYVESAFEIESSDTDKEWELAAEVGGSFTTGNTKTKSFKAKLKGSLGYEYGRITYIAQSYRKKDNDEVSANRWKISLKNNLHFSEHASSFAIAEYEKDQFAEHNSISLFAAGYTQRLYDNEYIRWDADIGPGYNLKKFDDRDESQRIAHIGTNLKVKFSDQSEFSQKVVADLALDQDASDIIRSESALSTSILENLKMKLAFALRRDSLPGEGKEKTDTETSVSLVFIF